MKHPCDEIFIFFGSDPDHPEELGGEIECWLGLGEDAEQFILTKTTVMFVPANLGHCPIYYRKVDKPPIFQVTVADIPQLAVQFFDIFPPGYTGPTKG